MKPKPLELHFVPLELICHWNFCCHWNLVTIALELLLPLDLLLPIMKFVSKMRRQQKTFYQKRGHRNKLLEPREQVSRLKMCLDWKLKSSFRISCYYLIDFFKTWSKMCLDWNHRLGYIKKATSDIMLLPNRLFWDMIKNLSWLKSQIRVIKKATLDIILPNRLF